MSSGLPGPEYEDLSKIQEMREKALPAEGDTEAMLYELHQLAELRRPDPGVEERYEELRDALVKRLKEEGPRYFIDEHGNKRFAWPTLPVTYEGNAEVALQLYEDGLIPIEVLDEIAPRKISPEGLRRAARRGQSKRPRKPGLSPELMLKVVRPRPRTGFVSFGNLEQSDEE